ncbi:MAG: carboxymethylenebutenolidase [Saprospiraceae bacterium]|jgi:carboxymethylenebutenolidase
MNSQDLSQDIYDLYDYYVHGKMERRQFIEKLSVYAVGGLTVPSILEYLLPKYAQTLQVNPNHRNLSSDYIEYNSPKGGGTIKGLLSTPANSIRKLPGIIVVHENRGLNPHIEDVGRRAALDGFVSLAPDALTPLGGYPGTDDEGRLMQRKRDRFEMLEDFIAALEFLAAHPSCNGNVGVVGFCFGGWISNMMAVRCPTLKAAVPFYGGQPEDKDVEQIQSKILIHYGALDKRVNAGWPDYEKALIKYGKQYRSYTYPDVNHGFHNDSTPRYNETAAKLAWKRTIEFFQEHLG